MIIETLKVKDIKVAVYNPRKDLQPGDPEYEKLRKSITEFDMVEPLVWNKRTRNLVGGHQRLKILKSMGIKAVEVSVVDLDGAKEKALNIALNKISGEWDFPALKDLLEELDTGAFDMEITGFDTKEIEDLMNQFHVPEEGLTEDDHVPEATESICKKGDLWQLGNHRLLCGDATLKADVEKLMGGEKADMVFTDPPYGIDLETNYSLRNSKSHDYHGLGTKYGTRGNYAKVANDDKPFIPQPVLDAFPCREVFMWGGDYYLERLPVGGSLFVWDKRAGIEDIEFTASEFEICWSKRKHLRQIVRVRWFGAHGTQNQDIKHRLHPTQKPIQVCQWFIDKFSEQTRLIADPFGGSGSTLIACEKLGRRCFMMEIDEHYCDVIIKRWEDYTGKKATIIDSCQRNPEITHPTGRKKDRQG